MALKDVPRTWLMNLDHESVTSWKDLCYQFVTYFMPTYERPATKNDLKAVHQYNGETLHQYIQCFSQMRNKIPRISNEEVIFTFSMGVANIKMKEKLSMNDELTSIVRLFKIADRCAKAKEGRLFVHNLLEALPPKPKSKDPKRKSISSRPPDSALGHPFSHSDSDIRPSHAPGFSFSPVFGLSSIRRAQAVPGFPRRARGLRTKQKHTKRRAGPRCRQEKG
jgi:hypothetical protein